MSITTKSVSTLVAALLGGGLTSSAAAQSCPQTSGTFAHGNAQLEAFATAGGGGVVYDSVADDLGLNKSAGSVSAEIVIPSTSRPGAGCSADFDEDTWPDYAGATFDGAVVAFWRNDTAANVPASPDWTDPSFTVTPAFTAIAIEYPSETGTGGSAVACGDFDGDAHADFFLIMQAGGDGTTPYRADLFLGNGDGTFEAPYEMTLTMTDFDGLRRDATPFVLDYESDGDLDFLLPTRKGTTATGTVRLFVNDGQPAPMFTAGSILLDDIPVGNYGAVNVSYMDFNRDGIRDLAVGSASKIGVLLYYGQGGAFFDAPLTITDTDWPTGGSDGAQVLFGGDFDLDGYNDLLVGLNQGSGHVFVWKDLGAPDYITNHDADHDLVHTFTDTDLGFPIDYDNDPAHTPDFVLIDYQNASYAFANRLYSQYVSCAEIASDIIDLGVLSTVKMVITAAQLEPTVLVPSDTSLVWSMSNEDPANWQVASLCPGETDKYCVAFTQPTGRSVRWRAELCTNVAHTQTPLISAVSVKVDYTLATTHFRAGVVVNQGVAYVGAFEEPGDTSDPNGHFYATNALLDKTYWDAGAKLDAMTDGERNVFSVGPDGTTRVSFDAAGAATQELQDTLGVATQADALAIVTWQRSKRFGLGGNASRLGSILTSTPAVLGPPQRPYFYNQVAPSEKSKIDAFVNQHAGRPILVLFGSKDGAIHAVQNDLSTIDDAGDTDNGKEVWAFIPGRIAAGFAADKTAGAADHYPDGSPTLADVKIGGSYKTVAIVGSGNGGKSYTALDVTDTKGPSSVPGPTPLWDYVPGGGNAGQATIKSTIIRVKIAGAERFLAVLGTGMAFDNTSPPYAKGIDVEAVDIATGARVWRFRSACPLSTDMIAYETDDELETGSPAPAIDGYIDRVGFADVCGNLYKINPGVEIPGTDTDDGWTAGLGPVTTGFLDPAGQPVRALFSVAGKTINAQTVGERPIAGTIGTRPDDSGRLALFFGTGGTESFDVLQQNAFFSIYADTGEIRDQLDGDCDGPNGACEKFYGGLVVTTDQVLVTRAIDPPIASPTCDNGSAEIVGLDVQDFDQEFVRGTSSSVVSSLYGDGGALFATTLSGEVIRVGTPAQPNATTTPAASTPPTNTTSPIKRRSWRELLY